MMIHDTIFTAYHEYLKYLDNGGDRVTLPKPVRNPPHTEDYLYASDLGQCPLCAAMRRRNEPLVIEQSADKDCSRLHLMQQGVRDAEPLQEALLWWGLNYDVGVRVEESVYDDELRIKGRIDALIYDQEGVHIVEFKRRDAPKGGNPQPKESDVFQAMTYKHILEANSVNVLSMNIVTINRYYFNTWEISLENYNEEGENYPSANSPDGDVLFINMLPAWVSWRDAIAIGQSYMDGNREVPFSDPLNSTQSGSWYCYQWENGDKPKAYKTTYQGKTERTEFIIPRCEYYCHGNANARIEARETGYQTGIYEFVKEQ